MLLRHLLDNRHGAYPPSRAKKGNNGSANKRFWQSIYYNSPYWLNMDALWSNWPTRDLTGLVKFYILAQCAFWLQQIVIIHIEERRKDHWQMLAHHFVTIGLIFSCYTYHMTQVGNLILITMDFIDIILPVSSPSSLMICF